MKKDDNALADSMQSIVDDVACYLQEIEAAEYKCPINILSGATVGQHTRHFVEFFQCLYQQFNEEGKVIDYGSRTRNILIETDPLYAHECLQRVANDIISQQEKWNSSLSLKHDSDMPDAIVSSSYAREIFYGIEHSIHHLAIIKIGLKALGADISLPEHFGIAPSTIKYRNQQCAQ